MCISVFLFRFQMGFLSVIIFELYGAARHRYFSESHLQEALVTQEDFAPSVENAWRSVEDRVDEELRVGHVHEEVGQ